MKLESEPITDRVLRQLRGLSVSGDHVIVIGRVAAAGISDTARQPLLYYANRYAHLRQE